MYCLLENKYNFFFFKQLNIFSLQPLNNLFPNFATFVELKKN